MPPESTTAARSRSSLYITADCNPTLMSSRLQPTTVTTPFLLRFYIDHEQGIAYFYPPAPITPGSVFLSLAPAAIVANAISGLILSTAAQPKSSNMKSIRCSHAALLSIFANFITSPKDTPLNPSFQA